MTDRELLELAAKAASVVILGFFDCGSIKSRFHSDVKWNPLTDDGDALRLAVQLEIFTGRFYDCVEPACFASWGNRTHSLWEPARNDPYAATRRAIVRAAAAIGAARE
jgi:hypothetical protein